MVCKVEPGVDYTVIHSKIRQQSEFVQRLVQSISPAEVVRQPNAKLLETRKCEHTDVDGLKEVFYQPNQEVTNEEEEKDAKEACFHFIVDQMINNNASWPFREPVGMDVAPDYFDIIKDPVDLSKMKKRIQSGEYALLTATILRRSLKTAASITRKTLYTTR